MTKCNVVWILNFSTAAHCSVCLCSSVISCLCVQTSFSRPLSLVAEQCPPVKWSDALLARLLGFPPPDKTHHSLFWILASGHFYTFSLLISIKIKALCLHTLSVLGPRASSVWHCGAFRVCDCDCVESIAACLMALIKQEVEIFYSECQKTRPWAQKLVIKLWRILKPEHLSAERKSTRSLAHSELLRGVTKTLLPLNVNLPPWDWHFEI